jgi:hypothetical protein
MPGDGRVVRQLDTLLKPRAIETTSPVSTIAHDEILGYAAVVSPRLDTPGI